MNAHIAKWFVAYRVERGRLVAVVLNAFDRAHGIPGACRTPPAWLS